MNTEREHWLIQTKSFSNGLFFLTRSIISWPKTLCLEPAALHFSPDWNEWRAPLKALDSERPGHYPNQECIHWVKLNLQQPLRVCGGCCDCGRSHLTASHCNSNESSRTQTPVSPTHRIVMFLRQRGLFALTTRHQKKKKSKNTRPPVFAAVWWSECRGVPDGTMQPHCHNERITYRANTIGLPFVPWGELKKTGHFGAYLWITSSPPTTVDQADFLGCSRNL